MQRTLRTPLLVLTLVAAQFAPLSSISAADFSAIWDGGNGNWSDPLHWNTNPNYPNNSKSGTYDATISSGIVTLDRNITIQRLFLSNSASTLTGAFELTLNEGLTWDQGGSIFNQSTVNSSTTINLGASSTSTIGTGVLKGTLNNAGTVNNSNNSNITSSGTINNLAGATWNIGWGINPFNGMFTPGAAGQFNNAGNVVVSRSSSSDRPNYLRTAFNNSGNVTLIGMADLFIDRGSSTGAFNLGADTNLTFGTYTLASGTSITGAGTVTIGGAVNIATDLAIGLNVVNPGMLSVQSGKTLTLNNLVNQGTLSVQSGATVTLNGSYTHAGSATLRLNGGTITSAQPLDFNFGILRGSGTINADVITHSITVGELSFPSTFSAGKFTINGSLTILSNHPNPSVFMKIGGLTQGTEYDYIDVNGTLSLDGRFDLRVFNGFELELDPSQTFTLFTSDNLIGAFSTVANGERLTTGNASFQVNYGVGSPFGANNVVLSDPRVVPEPASLVLFVGGLGALGLLRFRSR